ncbi:carbohydrate ABC transporter permease [Virgibacillus salexigens]|uniref:Lactose transport system permease protein LacF n=2 Tax=Virgibacillus TaxID=84406 RepID=A0A024Q853_9BACI|nr:MULTISPECIES: sugar ABC transporter permease [Virgibacillus]GGJ58126.1 sugar ABC transporter permease [Virgibacillus kapii]CDQ38674.1 Lactose transport system permease protein LacF [Virgibacillus massiliensis]
MEKFGNAKQLNRNKFKDYTFLLPSALFLLAFLVYPILYNILLSFKDINIGNLIQGEQPFVGIENYITVLKAPLFGKALVNSLIFTVATIIFSTSIGFALALLFNKSFPGHKWMRSILLIAWMTPIIIIGTVFSWMLSGENGIINEFLLQSGFISQPVYWLTNPNSALISIIIANIWISIPFSMVILLSGLQGLPSGIYEAAKIDGANKIKQFYYITLPLMKPTILVLLMLGVIFTFKVFDLIYIMTGGGPADSTQVIPFLAYQLSFSMYRFGEGAALSNISFFLIGMIAILYLYLIRKEEVM